MPFEKSRTRVSYNHEFWHQSPNSHDVLSRACSFQPCVCFSIYFRRCLNISVLEPHTQVFPVRYLVLSTELFKTLSAWVSNRARCMCFLVGSCGFFWVCGSAEDPRSYQWDLGLGRCALKQMQRFGGLSVPRMKELWLWMKKPLMGEESGERQEGCKSCA